MVDKVNTDMAVRWIIVLIIIVFDPLAVLLLIAGQQSIKQHYSNNGNGGGRSTPPILDPSPLLNRLSEKFKNFSFKKKDSSLDKLPTLPEPRAESTVVQEQPAKTGLRLSTLSLPKSFTFKKTETVVPTETPTPTVEVIDTEEGDVLEINTEELKERLQFFHSQKLKVKEWKSQQTNPRNTIKRLRFNYVSGMIDKLPWQTVDTITPPMPIDQWNQMLEQAEKALELDTEKQSKSYIIKEDQQQVRKTVAEEYVQNQEQTDQSIWNRIKK
jgi:hypothetical protein